MVLPMISNYDLGNLNDLMALRVFKKKYLPIIG